MGLQLHPRSVLGSGLVALALAAPMDAPAAGTMTREEWSEDLQTLVEEIEAVHANLYHTVSPAYFRAAADSLSARLASLESHEIVVEMAALVALVGDGHTRLTLPVDGHGWFRQAHTATEAPRDPGLRFHHLPIRLAHLEDGLFVVECTPPHEALLGARVTRIGTMSIDDALVATRPVVHRENDMSYLLQSPILLTIPEVLHALGITESVDSVPVTAIPWKGRNEDVATIRINLRPLDSSVPVEWRNAHDLGGMPDPLWLRDSGDPYWMEYLSDSSTLFVQYNLVRDKEEESVAAFAERVHDFIAEHGVERVIIDLRHNGGGDNFLNPPLLHAMIRSENINRHGRLFVFTGRRTFSAAMNLCVDMERHTRALFVGEPTGGKPNSYGDSRRIRLPHCGLTVRASTLYWQDSTPFDTREWIAPDIWVPITSEDYFRNRDPLLDAVLDYSFSRSLREVLNEVLAGDAGLDAAFEEYRRYRADSRHRYADTEPLLNEIGYRLLLAERPDDAIRVFERNVEDHPELFNVHDSLGEAYAGKGRTDAAIRSYEESLRLNPDNRNAEEMLARLRDG